MPNIQAVPRSIQHANAMRADASLSPFLSFCKQLFSIPLRTSTRTIKLLTRTKAAGTTTPIQNGNPRTTQLKIGEREFDH